VAKVSGKKGNKKQLTWLTSLLKVETEGAIYAAGAAGTGEQELLLLHFQASSSVHSSFVLRASSLAEQMKQT